MTALSRYITYIITKIDLKIKYILYVTYIMEYFSSTGSAIPIEMFYNALEKGFDYTLPEYTINLINSISKKVGAPSYIKTPVFKKNVIQKNRRRKKKQVEEGWDDEKISKSQFTEGVTVKHEEIIITSIKGFLNKLTSSTYDDIRDSIFSSIKTLHEYIQTNDIDAVIMNKKLVTDIIDIISQNKLYVSVYARLIKELTNEFDTIEEEFNDQIRKRFELFDTFDIIDDCEDYDKTCKMNSDNETRRTIASFMCELMKVGMVDKEFVFHILNEFVEMLDTKMSEENNRDLCYELSNIIETVIGIVINNFTEHNGFKCLWEQLTEISERSIKEYTSLSNKTLFKVLDIIEDYEDIMD